MRVATPTADELLARAADESRTLGFRLEALDRLMGRKVWDGHRPPPPWAITPGQVADRERIGERLAELVEIAGEVRTATTIYGFNPATRRITRRLP